MSDHDVTELLADVRRGRLRVGRRARAVVLLLHGGRAEDRQPSRWKDVSYLRMLPFAWDITWRSRGRVAPLLVHNTHGGWVAPSGSGVVQARELIRGLVEEHSLPVVVLGHSSGGWAALRVAADPGVVGAVALAPWVAQDEPTAHLVGSGARVRVVHGEADEVCDPWRARDYVAALAAKGVDATFDLVPGGNHALLDKPWRWHARATRAVLDLTLARPSTSTTSTA
ncbi:dienelactone hydrolase family protein [Marihabitans asiaticum]|uniref:Dienelactone hydrolase family protein n=1 Tax=Marihabitans asiaticum TaxID=415218 RepID=A0A560WGP4_9MICO|nr:dienelactone hydrolase family protein [Marihabitans asiaticum]TWD16655.1 dienelactone hydrolase family protein [Marihabitans asiaticum]